MKPLTKLAVFMLAAAIALAVYTAASGNKGPGGEDVVPAGKPISHIPGNTGVYTVVTVIGGKETEKNILLFMEVCGGFGISAVFFMTTGYMGKNPALLSKIYEEGHTAGLICEGTSGLSRSGFMKYLANRNDEFYASAGRYPKYCLISGAPCPYAAEIINAYGQYYIACQTEIGGGEDEVIRGGYITAVNLSEDGGVYAFTRAVARGASRELTPVNMKEFLLKHESVVGG